MWCVCDGVMCVGGRCEVGDSGRWVGGGRCVSWVGGVWWVIVGGV